MNKSLLSTAVVLAMLIWSASASQNVRTEVSESLIFTDGSEIIQRQEWFHQQKVDHFNLLDNATFSQRYWVIDQFFDSTPDSKSPVILFICGEYTCSGVPQERLFPIQLAQKYKALILVLEHRYYGESSPVEDLSVENFKYLKVSQALEDLAYFVNWCKTDQTLNIGSNRKWIAYGGSYPGALSAWFRYKYPHLTVGAIASSSIVNAILDFDEFDHQVYLSMKKSGDKCVDRMREINKYVEDTLYKSDEDSQKLRESFNCGKLPNDEFLWFYTDAIAETVQYGKRTILCDQVLGPETFEERFENVRQWAINTTNPADYGSFYLRNTTIDSNTDSGRIWTWQFCSELGTFNTNYKKAEESMRSTILNLTFWYDYCERIFDVPVRPNVDVFNAEFGGADLNVENLIVVNGCEDPWQGESVLESKGDVSSYYIDCEDCGHCVELYTPTSRDSWSLWWARTKIDYHVGRWIA